MEGSAGGQGMKRSMKVIVIGDCYTGKTSFVRRFTSGTFSEFYKGTIGVDFAQKSICLSSDLSVELMIWDIAGEDLQINFSRIFYQGAVAAIIVFDLSSEKTYKNAALWKKRVDELVLTSNGDPIPCLLIGNKVDITAEANWPFPRSQIEEFCRENRFVKFFEASARTNVNVEDSVLFLVHYIIDHEICPQSLSDEKKGVELSKRDSDVQKCC